jgi:hypothetical protein
MTGRGRRKFGPASFRSQPSADRREGQVQRLLGRQRPSGAPRVCKRFRLQGRAACAAAVHSARRRLSKFAVIGGGTSALDFPIANAYQPTFAGEGDGFISKITGSGAASTPTVAPTSPATSPTATRTATAVATATVCAVAFADVPPSSTFYSYIRCLACRGVVSGYPCGGPGEPCPVTYYRPNNLVTRGQVSKIVSEAAALTDP